MTRQTKIRIDKKDKIPIRVLENDREITFLFPPEESKEYFNVTNNFSKNCWRIPTARELSLLLTSAQSSSDRLCDRDVMSWMILHSWDYGLQSCTYLHPTSDGLFILEDPNLKDCPTGEELESRFKAGEENILFLDGNYSKKESYFKSNKDLEFFQKITCNDISDRLWFRINRGFVSFSLEQFGPTPQHYFGIYCPEKPSKMLYYPVLISSDILPRIHITTEEKQKFARQIDKFIKEQIRFDNIRSQSSSYDYPCGSMPTEGRKRYGLNPDV